MTRREWTRDKCVMVIGKQLCTCAHLSFAPPSKERHSLKSQSRVYNPGLFMCMLTGRALHVHHTHTCVNASVHVYCAHYVCVRTHIASSLIVRVSRAESITVAAALYEVRSDNLRISISRGKSVCQINLRLVDKSYDLLRKEPNAFFQHADAGSIGTSRKWFACGI